MALPALAVTAASAAARYGPKAITAAEGMLRKATGGKLTSISDIPKYVGKNTARMTVVADSMIRSGFSADDVLPQDLISATPELRMMRQAADRLVGELKQQFDSGADKVLPAQSAEDGASDVIRIKRVKAVLSVYGSVEKYFLCHPNGGVPSADFAYYASIKRAV